MTRIRTDFVSVKIRPIRVIRVLCRCSSTFSYQLAATILCAFRDLCGVSGRTFSLIILNPRIKTGICNVCNQVKEQGDKSANQGHSHHNGIIVCEYGIE